MMDRIANHMRLEAQRQSGATQNSRMAIVDSYDPSHYAVKVRLQPENQVTGWLPLGTPFVGNGFGLYAAPAPGDAIEVHFQQGDADSGFAGNRFFSASVKPLAVPSGEFWIVHKTGSFIKFMSNGDIQMHAAGKVIGSATEWDLTGNVIVTGDITATGEIYDKNAANGHLGHIRTIYDIHTHPIPGGNTNIPTQQL